MKSALTLALLSTTLLMPMAVQAQDNECQIYNTETSVFFTSDSVELGSTAMAVIDQLAENLQSDNSCVVDTLKVTGHVDWKEIKTSSPMLSFVRAMTVGDVLVGKGFVTDVIAVAGYGARVSNPDGNGMIATERRAEIKITMRPSATE